MANARRHPLRPIKAEEEEEPLQQTFELQEKHVGAGESPYPTTSTLEEVKGTVQHMGGANSDEEEEVVILEKGTMAVVDGRSGAADSDEEEVILEKTGVKGELPPSPPKVEEEEEETINRGKVLLPPTASC